MSGEGHAVIAGIDVGGGGGALGAPEEEQQTRS